MNGIVSYGTYLPHFRLQRAAIAAALGTPPAKGTRSVASYDEDSTSMGVEAGRIALRRAGSVQDRVTVLFSTTTPGYQDKTNATAVRAALALGTGGGAYDMVGSMRSAVGAFHAAAGANGPTLVVAGDVRTGLPGAADESLAGDAGSALLFGPDEPIAEVLAASAASDEFLDRWRVPGAPSSQQWEERFGETAYVELAEEAVGEALKRADLLAGDVDHLIVTSVHPRSVRRVTRSIGVEADAIVDDMTSTIGTTGTAHPGLLLADVLDRADPDATILLVVLSDGADAIVLRTTPALAVFRDRAVAPPSRVADQVARGDDSLSYQSFLTWRGMLDREPPRRPDPVRPAGPVSLRRESWKFAFVGSRCTTCGTRHLPPARVCVECDAVDEMTPEALADVEGSIATYTVDRLAFSLNPPVVAVVIDFDGGGRFQCEMTDVDPEDVRIGQRVEMTFRRLFTADGVHNYFWKARPVGAPVSEGS